MTARQDVRSEIYFERLSLAQRVQHFVLAISYILLFATGLPLRYPDSPVSDILISLSGGFMMRTVVHRVAAVMLISVTLYHIGWILFTRYGRSEFRALMPRLGDARDLRQTLRFLTGRSDAPEFDRFSFMEKFEYFAFAWGAALMALTGMMLWLHDGTLLFMPKWGLDIIRAVHSYEALLALLGVFVWHMYHVHLNPSVFPMSKVWLDGKMSRRELMERHPLEYDRISGRSVHWVNVLKRRGKAGENSDAPLEED